MAVLLALTRASLRRRWPLFGLAAVIALGLGVAIASLEAAARTESAYPDYLRRSNASDLVVNPSLSTDRIEAIISTTPGVRSYVSDALLNALDDRDQTAKSADIDSSPTQVRVSNDGRYLSQDRPVVSRGRMIRSGPEAFVNLEMAEDLGLRVGSVLPLAFFPNTYSDEDPKDVEPFGRAEVRVVGIGLFQDEVLADGLYPRHRVLITPEVGSRYDCVQHLPEPDDARPLEEIAETILPPGCAMSYRYFSLQIEGGARGVGRVTDALATSFNDENQRLPESMREAGIGFKLIPTVTSEEAGRVRRSLEPAVRSLQLFSVAAAMATIVIALLATMRLARRDEDESRIWRDLGASRTMRIGGVAAPLGVPVVTGLVASLVVGWLASGIGPLASVRPLDPGNRLGLSARPVLVVMGASSLALLAGLCLVAAVVTRPQVAAIVVGAASSRAPARMVSPSCSLGMRAATSGTGSRVLLAASATVVSAALATMVFSASLGGLVNHPARFGWPYDIAVTLNFGYGGSTDLSAVAETLDRPEVERWAVAALGTLTIGAESLPFAAGGSGFDAMALPVVKGKLPTAGDEIGLGALSARRLRIDVGDRVLVSTQFGQREATVSGLVVLPPVGPFQSERSSVGYGALLSARMLEGLLAEAAKEADVPVEDLAGAQAGFVAADLRPDADGARFLADISEQMRTWTADGSPPFVYAEPVRPATVANVAAMQAVPLLLSGLLVLTLAIGLVLAVAVAIRTRRRELAVLRALGCVGRQLRATVRWQALTVVVVGLLFGIPCGLAFGRVTYRAFAEGLGVRPNPEVSIPWVAAVAVGTVALGLAAAAIPGRRATRIAPALALRQE